MSWETVAWKTGEQMNEYLKGGSYWNRRNEGKWMGLTQDCACW